MTIGVAYLPKATVPAAIGGIPTALELPLGNIVLAVGVLSILLTASLGAIGMAMRHKKRLSHETK
ncbi:MAG: hypothetical protein IJC48_12370 [Clostridia bacterium]|nr:hypothetical protein [Clostridia bacterium]